MCQYSAVGTSGVGTGEARRRRQRSGDFRTAGRNGAVETPVRGPDNAFNTLERRGMWQPRSNGAARRARRGARRLIGEKISEKFMEVGNQILDTFYNRHFFQISTDFELFQTF
jgi:hypothetical protein